MYKALVIAYYYPPMSLSGVQRTLKFTKYFKDFNWHATVITTGSGSYFAYDDDLLKEAEDANVKIVRTESLTPHSLGKKKKVSMPSSFFMKLFGMISKTLFIPDNKKYWSRKAYKKASELLSKEHFDIIFISAPPFSSFVSFTKLKSKFDIPIILDYRDSWINNQFRFHLTPYHRYRHKKLEDGVLRKADRVIVVNRIIKENLLKNYQFLKFNDIDIIPHGYDPEDFENIVPIKKDNNKLVISYSGIFYSGISPKYLLKALKQLSIEKPDIAANIELHFIGYFKKENRKIVKKMKLESFVRELGYLSHKQALSYLVSSDVLWLTLPDNDRMFNVSPGKLFEYIGAEKPIFGSLPEGSAKNTVENYQASFLSTPENIDEIKNSLIKIHDLYIQNKLPKPDKEFIERYDRKSLTNQLTKIFQFYLKAD